MGNYPASQLDWNSIDNFSESEFAHTDLDKIDESIILELQSFREILGHPITPSPNKNGWARESGKRTSYHYAIGRLCNAGDVFVGCHIAEAFLAALRCKFGGIGIYLDTTYRGKPRPMLHVDLRPMSRQIMWLRETIDGEEVYTFFYPHKNPAVLCDILKKLSEVEA